MNHKMPYKVTFLFLLIILVLLSAVEKSAATIGATITVNSTADIIADDGECTLREAITAANTDDASGSLAGECSAGSGTDTITIPAGVYTLAIPGQNENDNLTGDLDVMGGLVLSGAGTDLTIIEAGTTSSNGIDRVLHVRPGASSFTVENLTIRHGRPPSGSYLEPAGAGILNDYYSAAMMFVTAVHFDNNHGRAGAGGAGDALHDSAAATVTITDSTFTNNGGIDINNFSLGGAIQTNGQMTIVRSTFEDNAAAGGGAIYFASSQVLTIHDSTFSDNGASVSGGGALRIDSGTVNISHSLFASNYTVGTNGRGGAIWLTNAQLNVANTTFSSNSAMEGGALYQSTAGSHFTNVTFVGNSATENAAIHLNAVGSAGTIFNLKNSIIMYSHVNACVFDGSNYTINGDNNRIEDDSCGTAAGFNLGPVTGLDTNLADNGGPTFSHALLAGSNAIDAVNDCTILASSTAVAPYQAGEFVFTDQRGRVRGDGIDRGGDACDIGAFEANSEQTNARPVADAGPEQTVTGESEVTLDGSASYDWDGTIVSYDWTQTGGEAVSLSSNAVVSPTFSAPSVSDILTFSLTVTDDGGLSQTSTVNISVEGQAAVYSRFLPIMRAP